jgi:serine/threonine protein kinase/tetratricopeptide (TPR) repeat protein
MVGETIAHYRVTAKLGAGGMGEVYRATDTKLDREVALKILPPQFSEDAERVARFEREARTASALNHPNIVTIYEVGVHGALRYIAMELVEGRCLRDVLAEGPPPLHVTLRLAAQISSGLAKAHEAGVIHRDLKPANIMVTAEGLAKIMDFGLAKLSVAATEISDSQLQTTDDMATSHGAVLGTPAYMSPEQAKGEPAEHTADQFSFGCILYEMATGKRAFHRNTHHHTVAAIIYEQPEPADRLNPSVPAGLAAMISRCLEKDPERRYPETRRVARDLEAMQVGHMVKALRPHSESHPSGYVAPGQSLSMPTSQTRAYAFRDEFSARRRRLLPIFGVLALAAGVALVGFDAGGLRTRFISPKTPPGIKSIAVLPLRNLSGDPEQEYFADGMTESLIMELAQISALRKVTSHTSVMQYKGKQRKMPELARELSVDAVVEGSVQRAGEKVQITVQLVDARADRSLWSRSYERESRDILSLQREMARAIAGEIRVQLTPSEQTHFEEERSVHPAALDAYLRGRYLTDRRTRESLDKAVEYFQQAIAADPNFAPAYSGLAHALREQEVWGGIGIGGAADRIRENARKALELDPNLADAHFALAASYFNHDWNWAAAEQEYRQALSLNPKFPEALSSFAYFLQTTGRQEEAIETVRRAVELAPTAVTFVNTEGRILYRARKYEEAEASFLRALQLDQYYPPIYGRLADTYAEMGRYADALEILERGRIALGEKQPAKRPLGYVYARMGKRREALAIAREVERTGDLGSDYFSPAAIYAALGDRNKAFALLEAGVETRNILPVTIIDPKLDPLRSDPRFHALRRRLNLPGETSTAR